MNTENANEEVAADVQAPDSIDKTQVLEPVSADASVQKTQVLPKVSDTASAPDATGAEEEGIRDEGVGVASSPEVEGPPADSDAAKTSGSSQPKQTETDSAGPAAQQAETPSGATGLQQAEMSSASAQAQQATGAPVGANVQQAASNAPGNLVPTVPIDPQAQRPWPMRGAAASDLSYQSWQVPMISPTGQGKPGQREIPAQSPTPHLSSLQSASAGLAAAAKRSDASSGAKSRVDEPGVDAAVDTPASKRVLDVPSIDATVETPAPTRVLDVPRIEKSADSSSVAKHAGASGSKEPAFTSSINSPADMSGFDKPADMSGFDKAGDFMRALDANSSGQAAGFVNAGFELPKQRRRGGLKVFAIVIGTLLLLLVAAYVAGFVYFSSHFPPGTTIGEIDASLKTAEEVEAALDAKAGSYTLTVKGGDFNYSTDAASIGYAVNSPAIVQAVRTDLDPALWPLHLLQGSHDEAGKYSTTYDEDLLKTDIKKAVKKYNADAEAPVDASIEYNETSNKFEIKPEEYGTKYGVKAVQKAACAAVDAMEETVVLNDDMLAKPKITADDERIVEAADAATAMVASSIDLKMEGYDLGHVDGDQLAEYVSINEDYEVELDEDGLWDYLNTLVSGFNTVGGERSYTREDGKEITVVGGDWGWNIDVGTLRDQVYEMVKAGESGTVEATYWQSGQVYNGPYERDWGKRYADVDLSEQHAYLYGDDGELIWESDCITGEPTPEKETPTGVWSVQAMRTDELLKTYEPGESEPHETNVSYWMPFVGNLDAFHDAWWQPGFGGTMYADGYGSHGCVNLPSDAAAELYGLLQVGDVVVVHW